MLCGKTSIQLTATVALFLTYVNRLPKAERLLRVVSDAK
jgi:hypothetical protein